MASKGTSFTMSVLVFKAYGKLIHFDLYLVRGNFPALYEKVRNYPVRKQTRDPRSVEDICCAVDMACIWYWKEALCLQRSAATACLLRQYGVSAQLVIGAQQMPFKAHAWVEVEDRVVNDKPYMHEMYAVLDRC
jgi:transglutaminase superfamily protein